MSNAEYKRIEIDGVDCSDFFPFPFLVNRAQNAELDYSVVDLVGLTRAEPFEPFSLARLAGEEYAVVSDEVQEYHGRGLYRHTVTLMEQTKEAERIIMGAKTFTNPIQRSFSQILLKAQPGKILPGGTDTVILGFENTPPSETAQGQQDPIFRAKTNEGFPVIYDLFGKDFEALNPAISVFYDEISALDFIEVSGAGRAIGDKNKSILWKKEVTLSGKVPGDILLTVPTAETGYGNYGIIISYGDVAFAYNFELIPAGQTPEVPPYTVADVVNRLLDTAETRRLGDAPRYTLRYRTDEQSGRFQLPAPQFRFSNGRTLWENLWEVGQYMHAIPRIEGKYLYFDDLGGSEKADLSGGEKVGGGLSANAGDYAAGLDSIVSNLVNMDDLQDGSITEPFEGGRMTIRAETEETRIGEKTGIISTSAGGIEKIIKVMASFKLGGAINAADITPYIFEKSEYDLLSSFSGSYPTSKSYALYYTQGQQNIQGLWFKAQDSGSGIFDVLEKYSIVNILARASEKSREEFYGIDYSQISFSVSYIPTVNARVRQYKPEKKRGFPSFLAHNQTANKLSAQSFGENLRGQLAMLGNPAKTARYIFPRLQDVPRAGTLFDDVYYISSVSSRVFADFVVSDLSLSAKYNELGAYAEINNEIRQFEIPAAEERYVNIDEFCIIGKSEDGDADTMAQIQLMDAVKSCFGAYTTNPYHITHAIARTLDEAGNPLMPNPVSLPLMSLAIGNSLYFGFRFEDNFSAGSQAVEPFSSLAKYKNQRYVPYGDRDYARAERLELSLSSGGAIGSGDFSAANALPEIKKAEVSGGDFPVTTGKKPIMLYKDSAEQISVTYQLHFVSNNGYIIGSGLSQSCPAVRGGGCNSTAKIYYYKHRINELTGAEPTSGHSGDVAVNAGDSITCPDSGITHKAWAIFKDGKFLLGKNTAENAGTIHFTFQRRID